MRPGLISAFGSGMAAALVGGCVVGVIGPICASGLLPSRPFPDRPTALARSECAGIAFGLIVGPFAGGFGGLLGRAALRYDVGILLGGLIGIALSSVFIAGTSPTTAVGVSLSAWAAGCAGAWLAALEYLRREKIGRFRLSMKQVLIYVAILAVQFAAIRELARFVASKD